MSCEFDFRYEIGCSICGYICSDRTMSDAIATANRASELHKGKSEYITIYDRMAHRGKPRLYDMNGNIRKEGNDD